MLYHLEKRDLTFDQWFANFRDEAVGKIEGKRK